MTKVNIELFVDIWNTKYDPACDTNNDANHQIIKGLMYGED